MLAEDYVIRVNAQPRLREVLDEAHVAREGWATLHARPDLRDNGHALWLDLLVATRHATPFNQGDRQGASAVNHSWSWLVAGSIQNLVIIDPASLSRTLLLDLAHHVTAAGVRLWLVYTNEPADEREDAVNALGPRVLTAEQFGHARESSPPATDLDLSPYLEPAPDVHFLAFLDAAETLMSPEGFERVHGLFVRGREQIHEYLVRQESPTEEDLAVGLHEMTIHLTDPSEILAMARGAQAGALLAGWYLQIDIERWMRRSSLTNLSIHLDPSQWRTVRTLQSPTAAAICTLATMGLAASTIAMLDRRAIDAGVTSVETDNQILPIPEGGRACIVAQLVLHALTSDSEDPLLASRFSNQEPTARTVANALKRVTRQTGLAIRSTGAPWTSTRPWFNRAGISIRSIA